MTRSSRVRYSVVLLALFSLMALATSKRKSSDEKPEKGDTKEAPKKSERKAAKVGDRVEFDGVAWVVTEVKDLGKQLKGPNEFVKSKSTAGRFVLVQFKVTNKGKTEQHLLEDPKLVDKKDRTFGTFDEQIMYLPDRAKPVLLSALQPDVPTTFTAIYELPEGAEGLRFQCKTLELLGDETALVDLGI